MSASLPNAKRSTTLHAVSHHSTLIYNAILESISNEPVFRVSTCIAAVGVVLIYLMISGCWRRRRDSNPRYAFDVYSLSRGAPSAARPRLLTTNFLLYACERCGFQVVRFGKRAQARKFSVQPDDLAVAGSACAGEYLVRHGFNRFKLAVGALRRVVEQ